MSHRSLMLGAMVLLLTFARPGTTAPSGQADGTYREAQMLLRTAQRDTVGHGDDPLRLDSLGVAQMRLGQSDAAERTFRRVRSLRNEDGLALASLGKLALFRGRLTEAESLLVAAKDTEGASDDLYSLRLRRGEWKAAATMADAQNEPGRIAQLDWLGEREAFTLTGERGELLFERPWPVPLVKVRLNGTYVLMAVDLGAPTLLLDPVAVRVYHAQPLTGERSVFWNGARVAVKSAGVAKLELGGVTLSDVPAGLLPLTKYSVSVNPQGVRIVGVIGVDVLRRLDVTLDFKRQRMDLRRHGTAYTPKEPQRVPFELWGENEITAYGSVNGGRRMALLVATGLPEAGFGGPVELFEELGIKPGPISRMVKGAGSFLQGRPWAQVSVGTVSLGTQVSDKLPAWSGAYSSSELWRHGLRRDAMLGPEWFKGRRVTIDWTKQDLVFESNN
ncbi:MAG: aspartyl protease family protein [Candidatus Eisenbacteria bacterium]